MSAVTSPARILLADAEARDASPVAAALRADGHDVQVTRTGQQVLAHARTGRIDLILLASHGLRLCQRVRSIPGTGHRVPLIVLAPVSDDRFVAQALDVGADDCVARSVSAAELRARIRALLRRASAPADRDRTEVCCGPVAMDIERREVRVRGERVDVTFALFETLRGLVQAGGRPLTREEISAQIWGAKAERRPPRNVDVHIHKLRALLERDPADPMLILTARGQGYHLDPTAR